MLKRYVSMIISRPWWAIGIIAAITVFFGAFVPTVKMRLEPDQQLPPDHPLVVVGQELQRDFGGKYISMINVTPKNGTIYNAKVLTKIRAISDRALTLPGLRSPGVASLMSRQVQDLVTTDEDMEVKPLIGRIPETAEEMDALRARIEKNRTVMGTLVNREGTTATIIVDFADFEAAGGAENCGPAIEKIVSPERDQDTDIIIIGSPSLLYEFVVFTERINWLFALALLMIALVQYRTFRTLQGMVIPLVTAMCGVIWALGMMGLTGATIDPWNSMTPILVLAIAAGHSTQILKRYYEEFHRLRAANPSRSPVECNREAVQMATTRVGSVMLAAGAIAFLSFASLVTFTLPSVRIFGFTVAFGILASLIIEMTLIPAIRSLLRPPNEQQARREQGRTVFDPILERLAGLIRAGRERRIVWVSALIIAAGLGGAFLIEVNNNMEAQFFSSGKLIRSINQARQTSAGPFVMQVLVDSRQKDGIKDPDLLARMEKLQNALLSMPEELGVGHVLSIVDFLKFMNRRLLDDRPEDEVLPTSREAIGQILFMSTMSSDKNTILRFVDPSYTKASMMLNMKTDDAKVLERFISVARAEISSLFKGSNARVEVGGGIAYLIALNETIIRGKILNLLQITLIILFVSALLLRSIMGGFMVIIPLLSSIIINFGVMGYSGVWLSMGTAAISAMAAGIGADYAIYFIFRMREEVRRGGDLRAAASTTMTTSGKAIASVALAIATGYLCLALSGFKLHFLLGVLVSLMMVSSCLGALALLPALLVWRAPKFLTRADKRKMDSAIM